MQNNKQRKKIIIAIIAIITVFVIVPIIIFIISTMSRDETYKNAHDDAPSISLVNGYQLDYSIGYVLSEKLTKAITREILKEAELNSAPRDNQSEPDPGYVYITTLQETSFKKLPDQPASTYTFALTISDGRTYQVYIRVHPDSSNDDYLAAIIKRTDLSREGAVYVYYKDEAIAPVLTQWATTTDSTSSVVLQEKF